MKDDNNIRKVIETARNEIGGYENEIMDGKDSGFFNQTIAEQVDGVYTNIIDRIEREVRFLGKPTVKYLIEFAVRESEYNNGNN